MDRALAAIVALIGVSWASAGLSAPAKHPVKRPAATRSVAPKVDPVTVLTGTVMMNSVSPGDDLYKFCKTAKFQNVAYALQGVKGLSMTKTEFETQAQFEQRTASLTDAINGKGTVALCQYLDNNDDVSFSYDPDQEVFNVSFNPTLEAWRLSKKVGNYVSKTRMGIRATVHSSIEIDYVADMSSEIRQTKSRCVSAGYTTVSFKVPVKQADAQMLKLSGYLIILGRIVPPYYSEDDTHGSPTLDDPYDVATRRMTVPFNPSEIAIIDANSAKVWSCVL